ncbi:MAG: O-antigen ligase family protein [Beijerinckiaceae bacterium]
MSIDKSAQGRMQGIADFVLALRDICFIAVLPMLFRISFSGPSLEFSNRDQFFQGLANTGGNVTEQVGTLTLFAVSLMLMAVRGIPLSVVLRIALPLIPFFIIAILSIGWSDYPSLTLRRAMRLSIEGFTIIIIGVSYADQPSRLLRLLFYFLLAVVAGNAITLVLRPSSFTSIGFTGLHPHKLDAGKMLLIAIPVFLLAMFDRNITSQRRLGLAGLIIAIMLLPLTRAKTALVAIPIATVCAYGSWRAIRTRALNRIIAPTAIILILAALALIATTSGASFILEKVFGDTTITGRDIIWRFVFDRYRDHEMFGVGYGGLWQTGPELVRRLKDGYRIYVVNQAHNGYLEALVQTGIVGSVCLFFALALMALRLLRGMHAVPPHIVGTAALAIYLYIAMLIINLTDTTLFWSNTSLWAFPVLFYAMVEAARIIAQEHMQQRKRTLAAALRGRS